MADNRSFSPSRVRKKKDDYHGGCRYFRTSPDMAAKGIASLNIDLAFEDALRLSTAIQSAIMQLNRYDRRDKGGKEMGLCLSIKKRGTAISVIEVQLKEPKAKRSAAPATH
jgi:hypothetical protein